jgi:hypothetical protein
MVIAKAEKYAHVVVRADAVESFRTRSSRSGAQLIRMKTR